MAFSRCKDLWGFQGTCYVQGLDFGCSTGVAHHATLRFHLRRVVWKIITGTKVVGVLNAERIVHLWIQLRKRWSLPLILAKRKKKKKKKSVKLLTRDWPRRYILTFQQQIPCFHKKKMVVVGKVNLHVLYIISLAIKHWKLQP